MAKSGQVFKDIIDRSIDDLVKPLDDQIKSKDEKLQKLKQDIEDKEAALSEISNYKKELSKDLSQFNIEQFRAMVEEETGYRISTKSSLVDQIKAMFTQMNEDQANAQLNSQQATSEQILQIFNQQYNEVTASHREFLNKTQEDETAALQELAKMWEQVYNTEIDINSEKLFSQESIDTIRNGNFEEESTNEEGQVASPNNEQNKQELVNEVKEKVEKDLKNQNTSPAQEKESESSKKERLAKAIQLFEKEQEKATNSQKETESQLDSLGKEEKKISKASAAIAAGEGVLNALTSILSLYTKTISDAANKITESHKANAETFAVLTDSVVNAWAGTDQYYVKYEEITKQLVEDDLDENISAVDIMNNYVKLLEQGITNDKASEQAYQNTINQKIAPFVDTTTAAYTQLSYLPRTQELIKKLTGMGNMIAGISGNQNVFKESINTVIDQLLPVQLWAENELYSVESFAKVQMLYDQGYITEQQGVQLISDASKYAANPYEALTSNQYWASAAAAQGATTVDEFLDYAIQYMGMSSSSNYFAQAATMKGLGVDSYFAYNANTGEIVDAWNSYDGQIQEYEEENGDEEDSQQELLESIITNVKTTTESIVENTAQVNEASSDLSKLQTQFPLLNSSLGEIFTLLVTIIDSIDTSGTAVDTILKSASDFGEIAQGGLIQAAENLDIDVSGFEWVKDYNDKQAATEAEQKKTTEAKIEAASELIPDSFTDDKGTKYVVTKDSETGFTVDIADNTKMASGGYVTSQVDNVTIGESGKEAVIPLEKNTEWADMLASKINTSSKAQNITIGNKTTKISVKAQEQNDKLIKTVMDLTDNIVKTINENGTSNSKLKLYNNDISYDEGLVNFRSSMRD